MSFWWKLVVFVYVLIAIFILAIKWVVVPSMANYQTTVEDLLSNSLGRPVSVESFTVSMPQFQPYVVAKGIRYADVSSGLPSPLEVGEVRAEISLKSLIGFQPRLTNIEVIDPTVSVIKLADGKWLVAGLLIDPNDKTGPALDWQSLANTILNQGRILVKGLTFNLENHNTTNVEQVTLNASAVLQTSINGFDFALNGNSDQLFDKPLVMVANINHPIWLLDKAQYKSWEGKLYLGVDGAQQPVSSSIAEFANIDILLEKLSLHTWIDFDAGAVSDSLAQLSAGRLSVKSSAPTVDKAFELKDVTGDIRLKDLSADLSSGELEVVKFQATHAPGAVVGPLSAAVKRTVKDGLQTWQLQLLDIDAGLTMALAQDLTVALNQVETVNALQAYGVSGLFRKLGFSWTQAVAPAEAVIDGFPFVAEINFENLAVEHLDLSRAAGDQVTGFKGLDGSFSGNNQHGQWSISSDGATFRLPELYPSKELTFDRIEGRGSWEALFRQDRPLSIGFDAVEIANPDIEASLTGSYQFAVQMPDIANLSGQVIRADIEKVPYYLPAQLGPRARGWLEDNLLGGNVVSGTYVIKGPMDKFPFAEEPDQGEFLVDLQVDQAKLTPTPDWPVIENIQGQVVFNHQGLLITGQQASTMGMPLDGVSVAIEGLYGATPTLVAVGKGSGDVSNMITYVNNSPVGDILGGLLTESVGTGSAEVGLQLKVPLAEDKYPEVNTQVSLRGIDLRLSPSLPALSEVSGKITISPNDVALTGITGKGLGGPVIIDGGSAEGGKIKVLARGTASGEGLAEYLNPQLKPYLSGSAPFSLSLVTGPKGPDLLIKSDLQGLAISLPEPFGKNFGDITPLTVRKTVSGQQGRSVWAANIAADSRPEGRLSLEFNEAGQLVWLNASVGAALPSSTEGIRVNLKLPELDATEWQTAIGHFLDTSDQETGSPKGILSGFGESHNPVANRTRVGLEVERLTYADRVFSNVALNASASAGRWQLDVQAQGTNGYISWQKDDTRPDGAILARFARLTLPEVIEDAVVKAADEPVSGIPALDVVADSFYMGELNMGKLSLVAENQSSTEQALAALTQSPRVWDLRNLTLVTDDSVTKVSGQWTYQPGFEKQRTSINIDQTVTNGGEMLARLGKGEIFKGGQGTLKGQLYWNGSPLKIDYASLGGDFEMLSEKGRFLKADPGAAKLLGVLSLQSLTRRLQFNFSDLFNQGFEYDKLSTKVAMDKGIATTNNFTMAGPAATVLMEGSLNLDKETQALDVVVLPDLSATGGSIIYSILAANPAVGVASLFADLVLKDQLAKVFSLRYRVTGPWAEPIIEEVKRGEPKGINAQPQGR